jgi:RNA polymerase sigma-70 factor (sigma-E family)
MVRMTAPVRVSAGQEAAAWESFDSFFLHTYQRLARAALLLTGNEAEAEDIAQETMARVYERWDRVAAMESPEGYVYRVAMNVHRRHLRWLRTRARRRVDPPAAPDPLSDVDARVDLLRAVVSLPERQRQALILVDWVGLAPEQAGRVLGIAPGAIRTRVHRARSRLRDMLGGLDA